MTLKIEVKYAGQLVASDAFCLKSSISKAILNEWNDSDNTIICLLKFHLQWNTIKYIPLIYPKLKKRNLKNEPIKWETNNCSTNQKQPDNKKYQTVFPRNFLKTNFTIGHDFTIEPGNACIWTCWNLFAPI